jgi:uncharacterized membrane protein
MGKIAVTAACGLLAFGLSDLTYYTDPVGHAGTYLSSPLMPVLISVLVGYTISNLFLQVSHSVSIHDHACMSSAALMPLIMHCGSLALCSD